MQRAIINVLRPSALLRVSHWKQQCLCTRLPGYLQSRQLSGQNYRSPSIRCFSSTARREQDALAEKKNGSKKKNGKRKGKSNGKAADKEPVTSSSIEDDTAGRKVFVGQLPLDVDRMRLMREFREFGEVNTAYILRDRETGEPRGCAFVEFATAEGALAALAQNRVKEIDGAEIIVSRPNPLKSKQRKLSHEPSDGLFVGNIGNDTTADDLARDFEDFGPIVGVYIPIYPEDGKSRGFGVIKFKDIETAQKALDGARGRKIRGRTYMLDFAIPHRTGDINEEDQEK